MAKENEPQFNAGAAIYDSFTFLRGPAELTAGKANILPGQKVLDIACGSGWATMVAARSAGENGHVTGIDIADKLLEVARQKAASSGLLNIDYRVGDIHDLDFNDSSFDVVLSTLVFSELNEDERRYALKQSERILKPGGLIIIADEVVPRKTGRRIFHSAIRLPLLMLTYLMSGKSTRPIADPRGEMHAADFDIIKEVRSRGESFTLLVGVKSGWNKGYRR